MGFLNMINPFYWLVQIIYMIWLGGAMILNLIEKLFRIFAGLEDIPSGQVIQDEGGDTISIVELLIRDATIGKIFVNLTAFAVIMLIFFTIIQIIREHYKDKHGGNPYVLVFRMVKALVLFSFIQFACIAGLQLSQVVLRALDSAIGQGKQHIGGMIFKAMAAPANRVARGDDASFDGGRDTYYYALIKDSRDPTWIWTSKPDVWVGSNPEYHDAGDFSYQGDVWGSYRTASEMVEGRRNVICSGNNECPEHSHLPDFKRQRWMGPPEYWTCSWIELIEAGNRVVEVLRFNVTNPNDNVHNFGTDPIYRSLVWVANRSTGYRMVQDGSFGVCNYDIGWNESINIEENIRGGGGEWLYLCFFMRPNGSPEDPMLRRYGEVAGSYFYLVPGGNNEQSAPLTIRKYYETAYHDWPTSKEGSLKNDEPDSRMGGLINQGAYASWIDSQMMKPHTESTYYLRFKDNSNNIVNWFFPGNRDRGYGRLGYTNPRSVNALYNIWHFNWIIGFGGLFVALGVFNSFLFGMIQRIAELAVLYVFAPVTLAFFPFDDGAQFNNSFVKPFYKKVIASFAPVLSLNLFFVAILPAFGSIRWFDGYVANALTTAIVSLALLAMLPKVRTSIQTMLGADPMEERKMFGKGSITGDAWNKGMGAFKTGANALQRYGQARDFLAGKRHAGKQERQAKRDAAVQAAIDREGGADKLSADRIKELQKQYGGNMLKSGAARAALRSQMRNEALDADIVARGGKGTRMGQALRNKLTGKRPAGWDKKLENKDIDGINNDRNSRHKAWQEYADAAAKKNNWTDEQKQKFFDKMKDKRFTQEAFDKLKGRGGLKTREEALRDEWAKKGKGVMAQQQKDKVKAEVEKLMKAGYSEQDAWQAVAKKIAGLENVKGGAGFDWNGAIDKNATDANFKAWLGADGKKWLETNREPDKDTVRARAVKDKQKRLDQKRFEELAANGGAGFIKLGMNKDSHGQFFDASTGLLKSGDALKDAWQNELDNPDGNVRGFFGIRRANMEGIKGALQGAGRGLLSGLHTAVSPWKMVNTVQGGLDKLMQQQGWAGTMATALFDPDNGILTQNEFAKTMDGFSYYQTFKSFDKWENAKADRLKYQGHAAARTYRFTGAFAANAGERADIEGEIADAREQLDTTKAGTEERYKAREKDAHNAREKQTRAIIDAQGSAEERTRLEEALDPSKDEKNPIKDKDSESYRFERQRRLDLFMTGNVDQINKEAWSNNGGETFRHLRETAMKSESVATQVQQYREQVTQFERFKSLAVGDDGKFRTVDDFVESKRRRLNQLDEYDGIGVRILGISESDKQDLKRLKDELFDENSMYTKVKRAFERGHREANFNIDGKIVDISSNAAFKQFQAEQMAKYEKVVKTKVDMQGVAFRDYGEKTGDRLDGIQGAMMAEEQVKLAQDTIQKTSRESHQLFRDPEFVRLIKDSKWTELSDQFMAASQGRENNFSRDLVGDVKNKGELAQFGMMFREMMGDADGEMRGQGFAVASNIVARTFRMAFVDQITGSLEATRGLLDQQQLQAMTGRDAGIADFSGAAAAGDKIAQALMKGLGPLSQLTAFGFNDGSQIEAMQKKMLANLEAQKYDSVTYNAQKSRIENLFRNTLENLRLRQETNAMTYRIRELTELDFIARNMVDRKDNRLQ